MSRWMLVAVRTMLTVICVLGVVFFFVSAFLGGCRIDLGFTLISCRTAERPLIIAVVSGLIAALMYRKKVEEGECGDCGLSRAGWIAAGVSAILFLFLLWSRSGYLSYYRLLVRLNDYVYPPLWLSTAIYLAVGAGTLGLWLKARKSDQSVSALVVMALFLLSPVAFYIGRNIALAYVITILAWFSADWLFSRKLFVKNNWLLIAGLVPVGVIIAAVMYFSSDWSFHNISSNWKGRLAVMPMFVVLLITGVFASVIRRGDAAGLQSASAIALLAGLPFAGRAGGIGDAGAVFLVPLTVVLAGQGAQLLVWNRWTAGRVMLRNLAVLAIIGMIIGTARQGLGETICPPGYRYMAAPSSH